MQMAVEGESTGNDMTTPEWRSLLRRLLTALFIGGALYATVLSFLWFAADFIAASIYSPNLDQAQQVSDFNDFAYIADTLASYRFPYGALALVMSIALLVLAVLINDPLGTLRRVFIAGVVALGSQALLLSQGFHWGFALLFVATAATLYLATEWLLPGSDTGVATPEEVDEEADWSTEPILSGPDASGIEVEILDAMPEEVAEVEAEAPDATAKDTTPKGEAMLMLAPPTVVEPEPESEVDEVEDEVEAAQRVTEPPLAATDEEEVDTRAMESLALEIESDLNLDLEPDYQLAHDPGEDLLLLLSQEDLGIVDDDEGAFDDDTIETAAKIEAEVSREMSLEQEATEEVEATIEMADDEPVGVVVAREEPPPVPEDASPETLESAVAPDFDPQELARQESLLPPPRKRVWSMLDWVIVSIVVIALLALLLLNL